jgi:hypothetical protein
MRQALIIKSTGQSLFVLERGLNQGISLQPSGF